MSNEKMREEFEAWCIMELGFTPEPDGDDRYKFHNTESMWQAWQASRAALCVNLPCQTYDYDLDCDTVIAHHVGKALDAAGVSYK